MGGPVKRSAVHAPAARADEAFRAREHLLRGAAREGQQEDALGARAAIDQVRDAIDERACFSRAGSGHDQERPVAVRGGGELLGVQLGRVVAGLRSVVMLAGRVDAWLLGHRAGIYVEARSLGVGSALRAASDAFFRPIY